MTEFLDSIKEYISFERLTVTGLLDQTKEYVSEQTAIPLKVILIVGFVTYEIARYILITSRLSFFKRLRNGNKMVFKILFLLSMVVLQYWMISPLIFKLTNTLHCTIIIATFALIISLLDIYDVRVNANLHLGRLPCIRSPTLLNIILSFFTYCPNIRYSLCR